MGKRFRIEIAGVVQGVGFRPFVYAAAKRFGVRGFVGNESKGVFIEAEGESVAEFADYLQANPPPLAHIASFSVTEIASLGDADFRIINSESHAGEFTLISADISVCDDCLREMFDPSDRRYLYPFINCTNCGPRFTITRTVPYDRPNTTMDRFEMCAACSAEYHDPLDRRFHAQPISCWRCGPAISDFGFSISDCSAALRPSRNEQLENLKSKIQNLKSGKLLAIKGIGGFHLACDARNALAVDELRRRKGRIDKPFAVMCRDIETARRFAEIDDPERELLKCRERPIVLLRKRPGTLPESVAPNNRFIGIMLPYAPLHHLLFDDELDVLVMTSGNRSNEPIVKDNDEALETLKSLADSFLLHNRDIFVQCDDSVMRIWDLGFGISDYVDDRGANEQQSQIANRKSQILPVRRSRGYAPFPVELPFKLPEILAVGGELKAAFCLTKENFAFMSQHIGDMENLETLRAFENAFEQMKRLFRVAPVAVAGDLHPNYLSSNWARRNSSNFIGIQHHQAHVAAAMAENGITDQEVIGFAFDGTGYGTDGKIWGGEVFVGGYKRLERAAHLRYFPLAGGDVSVRNVYRLALGLLREAGVDWSDDLTPVAHCSAAERLVLRTQFERNLNTVDTSSFGRLFDAVASLAGVRQIATYEAQAAIEFEAVLDDNEAESYEFEINGDEFDYRELIRQAVADVRNGIGASRISAKFHNAVARLIVELSVKLRRETGIGRVALTGGCFQNLALLRRSVAMLERNRFEVLIHRIVPPNDGGLALGQAVLAGIRISDL
ncbi:MAG: carbamoyltransferase HypF [Acidobacteria bacterium]|nr:carbamoyltransferase HypF [Acidobacteriota bacterium]